MIKIDFDCWLKDNSEELFTIVIERQPLGIFSISR